MEVELADLKKKTKEGIGEGDGEDGNAGKKPEDNEEGMLETEVAVVV